MLLQDYCDGPFWMTPQERVDTNFGHYDEPLLNIIQSVGYLLILKSPTWICLY